MAILESNPLPSLVARYRKLKAQRDKLDSEMTLLKDQLAPVVEASGGKWNDDRGYVKMVQRKNSVTYSSSDVDRLAITWSESNDPIMQACGKMLLALRKPKAGYSYLQVK